MQTAANPGATTAPTVGLPNPVTLSLEELLVVLLGLGLQSIPGIDAEAWTRLEPDLQNLTLIVAQRALQARDLARPEEGGRLWLHPELEKAIRACANADSTVLADHWETTTSDPERLYAHRRGADAVVHTSERALHRFSLLPFGPEVVDQLLAACRWQDPPEMRSLEFRVPPQAFQQACDAIADGEQAVALRILSEAGVEVNAAATFVHAMTGEPALSIFQTVKPQDGQNNERSFTLIRNETHGWLALAESGGEDAPLVVKAVGREQVQRALLEGL
jgi:hypothetical protein